MVQLLIVDDEPLVQIGMKLQALPQTAGRHIISFWKSIRKL